MTNPNPAQKVEIHHHYGEQRGSQGQDAQMNALVQQQHALAMQQQGEYELYRRRLFHSYLLCAVGLFAWPLAGLHRFYNGKPISGLLWMFTGGLIGIGTFIDFLTMKDMVADSTRRLTTAPLPRSLNPAHHPQQALPPAANPNSAAAGGDPTLKLLKLAQAHNGKVTVLLAATELELSLQEVEAMLDKLVTETNHCYAEISEEGVIVYDFPAARVNI